MIVLVTGGSGSGKSEYAEEVILGFAGCRRVYIATMEVFGREDREKVARHRRLRAGKGFETLERPRRLGGLSLGTGQPAVVLLECAMNLVANEMFGGTQEEDPMTLARRLAEEIASLAREAEHLVIVTGEVGRDGRVYEEQTNAYIRLMGELNCRLASMADRVVEVVFGIPVVLKEEGRGIS